MTKMTESMERAYKWLADRGGSGVIDRYGNMVAAGEVSRQNPATWLRLVAAGKLVGALGRLSTA